MAETNTSNIGFEKQIWEAACDRGTILMHQSLSLAVLGSIFLQYIGLFQD